MTLLKAWVIQDRASGLLYPRAQYVPALFRTRLEAERTRIGLTYKSRILMVHVSSETRQEGK